MADATALASAAALAILQDALGDAAAMGDIGRLRELLSSGASVNGKDRNGFNAMHRAAVCGAADAVSFLLAAGAEPDIRDAYGDTPLHYACFCGFADVVRVLLTGGADGSALSCDGRSPYSIALVEGHTAVVDTLTESLSLGRPTLPAAGAGSAAGTIAPPHTPASYAAAVAGLCDAAFTGDLRALHAALVAGVDVNGCDAEGFTPLHRAAAGGSSAAVEALLDHGADPNARDPYGATPLHFAALTGRTEVVHVLLTGGADPARRTREGVTPLDVAKADGRSAVVTQLSETFTHIDGVDLSWGVLLEGIVQVKRGAGGLALFSWKEKYAVLSRPARALLLWTGTRDRVDSPIVRIRADAIATVVHDAKASSRRFIIKPLAGEPLELGSASSDDAALWVAALRALMAEVREEESRRAVEGAILAQVIAPVAEQRLEVLATVARARKAGVPLVVPPLPPPAAAAAAGGSAAAAGGAAADTGKGKDGGKAGATGPPPPPSAAAAAADKRSKGALLIQRMVRGLLSRRRTRGWVRVVDDTVSPPDIYWYNVVTEVSS